MTWMRKFLVTVSFLFVIIVCSGWGSGGHRKINEHAPASFPYSMSFLKASWTIILADHCSDADKRKSWDPSERPKHYIDIDDYPEFLLYGKIPQTYDSICALHGESFVIDKGTLPWATLVAYDSLRCCFERMDWSKAGLFAADLGHYVADGHQPLHITRNYNGQYTNQTEIHSRYETHMIGDYLTQIIYTDDSVSEIQDVSGYIFSYLYYNYKDVDSLLRADSLAHAVTGSTSSNQYYSYLWESTRGFTVDLFKRASYALAGLIYSAWIEAGSPVMPAYAIDELTSGKSLSLMNQPNPFSSETRIRFMNMDSGSPVLLRVFDVNGKMVATLQDGIIKVGMNEIKWDARGCRPGIYYISLVAGSDIKTIKAILFN
jgi:hypothetical protein